VAVVAAVAALTACNYDVTFQDCQVECNGSGDCPDSLTCESGLCRVEGAIGSCGSGSMTGSNFTLTQTANNTVDRNLVFDCTNSDHTTAAQSWFRVFSPKAAGVSGAFHVTMVNLGICFANDITPVTVTVGAYAGGIGSAALDTSEFSLPTMVTAMVPATQITELVAVPIDATIPAGMNTYVEIDAMNLVGTGNEIAIGSTDGAQTEPAYVQEMTCSIDTPTSTTAAGLTNAAFVITMEGSD
jgi:hypothetical protein